MLVNSHPSLRLDALQVSRNLSKPTNGLAPSYLADVCTPVSSVVSRWQLRSANSGALVVPRTRTTIGRRDFAVAGPATWNTLPVDLQISSLSRNTFAKKTQNSFIWLRALLRSSLIGRYTNWHIHSFIHACQNSQVMLGCTWWCPGRAQPSTSLLMKDVSIVLRSVGELRVSFYHTDRHPASVSSHTSDIQWHRGKGQLSHQSNFSLPKHFLLVGKFSSKSTKCTAENPQFGKIFEQYWNFKHT